MAVPKRKTSKHRKRKRRSHLSLDVPAIGRCARCGASTKPHAICDSCGHYRGTEVFPQSAESAT